MNMRKLVLIASVGITLIGSPGYADHPGGGLKHHAIPCEDPCGPPKCKMCGKKVCFQEMEKVKVKKTVFDVECKEVCIPGIRFPSLFGKKKCDDCTPHCGRVRKVRVLVVKEVEEEVCRCKWNIVDCPQPCAGPCEHVGEPCPIPGLPSQNINPKTQPPVPERIAPPKK